MLDNLYILCYDWWMTTIDPGAGADLGFSRGRGEGGGGLVWDFQFCFENLVNLFLGPTK